MTDTKQIEKSSMTSLPVVPIRDGIVFPGMEMILTFGRTKSITAVETAMQMNKQVVLVMQKNPEQNEPDSNDMYSIATVGEIVQMMRGKDEVNALVRGIAKVKVLSWDGFDPYWRASVMEIIDSFSETDETKALMSHVSALLRQAVSLGKSMDFLSFMNIMSGLGPLALSYHTAGVLDLKPEERQKLLELTSVKQRLEDEITYLTKEIKILELEKKIANKTQAKFDKSAKEQILRERIKTIEKELGEDDENKELDDLDEKIKKAGMPEDVKNKAEKELKRLKSMSQYNPESSYVRTYIETLIELPWSVSSANNVDIKDAEKVLDADHYGLKKVKERILEYLAVMKLHSLNFQMEENLPKSKLRKDTTQNFDQKGHEKQKEVKKANKQSPTILCFVGPPGVGKTSIGKSISRALKRKFVKMSLGGIRDEAEIRGHRRTYVGALPGRIIQGIKQAGTNNPVFMLDEIDKVGTDFRGDPSAALLEALDPEQNAGFSDHYLDVPFDLSDVFFITTCNMLDTIPPALRDRLEIIHFAGYTEDEKYNIAEGYLIDKQRDVHGIKENIVMFEEKAVRDIIRRYTREAGVRELERQIATVYRKIAKKIASGDSKDKTFVINEQDLHEYIGPYKYSSYLAETKDEIGMTTGLAWTQAGGDILFIEVALMPGKGTLILTGQLGDVMKESCQAALSYVRSRWKALGLSEKFYETLDIHIHVPEGAVPKDGPSAGVAITMALVSALTKIPAKRTVAMTGEITLRGRVLEIGGVKEKIIAAHRAGIKTVIMPKDNKKDLEDIPDYILKKLSLHFVEHADEVLKIALTKEITIKNDVHEKKL
jgi:ATP-dependent Lon protease